MSNILIATDGSERSLEAARYLRTLVDREAVRKISVLAVVRPFAAVPFASDFGEDHPQEHLSEGGPGYSFQRAACEAVERVAAELEGFAPEVQTLVWNSSPAEDIVRAAKEIGADLIVVGSRGSGRVDSIIMGSVSHRVLIYAHCPVLVVRPT